MAKNTVFIGYDYDCDNDKVSKDRLLEWDTKNKFDFWSYGQSFGVAVDSPQAVAIKQDFAGRIAQLHSLRVHRRQRNLPKRLDRVGSPQDAQIKEEGRGR